MLDRNGVNMFNEFNSMYEYTMSLTLQNKVEELFNMMHNVDS